MLKWLPFPSPVDHILSEVSTMTRPFLVALHGMPYSFFELDRAVVHAEAWPRGATPHLRSWAADKRSYPTSEVRGSGQECQAVMAQEWLRGATPHPRSVAVAGRSYPMSEVRGGSREEQPHFQGAVAARAPEGLEDLFHVQGQKWQQ